jgi:hypothetical protein
MDNPAMAQNADALFKIFTATPLTQGDTIVVTLFLYMRSIAAVVR